MVHSLRPDSSIKTFHDYAKTKVIPFIEEHLATATRVDVIWDQYLPESLKATTRIRRGAGVRQRLSSNGNGKMPKNWNSYLRNDMNKTELFTYLADIIANTVFTEGKIIITTCGKNVLQNPFNQESVIQIKCLSPCNYEEFDTTVKHAANAVAQGYKRILIIANDTDIIVIAISFFTEIVAEKLWVSFGIGKKFIYIS